MNSFSWNYRDNEKQKENNHRWKRTIEKREHTRLIIDEDSIYEIDLDCVECEQRDRENSF